MDDRVGLRSAQLDALYRDGCSTPSDIFEHLPTLADLAGRCDHVTEMGVRHGVSTRALLWAQPSALRCYDIRPYPEWPTLMDVRGRTDLQFIVADVLTVEIEPTELLFIDTWHIYDQLKKELTLHSARASKYIVLHDTESYRTRGESPAYEGLWKAVEEFVALGAFKIGKHYANCNGLTVLERA